MPEQLRPCPFCGGEASADAVRRWSSNHEAHWADGSEILEAFYVNCIHCSANNGGIFGFQTREQGIEHWNRRVECQSS